MVRVKICGITSLEDALVAVDAGADALGFIFYEKSPRHIFPEQAAKIIRALPPYVQTVGLFVNEAVQVVSATAAQCRLDIVQLHGDESPEYCEAVGRRVVKVFRIKNISSLDPMKDYRVAGYLLDAYSPKSYGGTGLTFNWDVARMARSYGPVILAGGLTPENVQQAVAAVDPFAVDVSSGVELSPGIKDHGKVREFVRRAKM